MGFSRQEYWSGVPRPPPGDLPDQGIEHGSPALQADSLSSGPPGKPLLILKKYGKQGWSLNDEVLALNGEWCWVTVMSLLAVHTPSSGNWLFKSFVHIYVQLFVFLLLSFESSLFFKFHLLLYAIQKFSVYSWNSASITTNCIPFLSFPKKPHMQ